MDRNAKDFDQELKLGGEFLSCSGTEEQNQRKWLFLNPLKGLEGTLLRSLKRSQNTSTFKTKLNGGKVKKDRKPLKLRIN
jgi:hypothetical protein